MTITIAIPSYNKEKYIERCLKSVLAQKEFIKEIIVIDNCSADKTFEIAKKYEPNVKCILNSSNIGMTGNWNRCIELCQSDLLFILHADDELLPGAIQEYLEFFNKHPNLGFVHANLYYIQDEDMSTRQFTSTHVLEISKAGPEAMALPKGYVCSTVVVPLSVYTAVGNYVESMSPDWEMLQRIASRYDVGQIDKATANVYINNQSTGRSSFTERTINETIADSENLSKKVVSYYPPELQKQKAKEFRDSATGLCILAFGRNLKVGNYKKATQALFKGLFRPGGVAILLKTVWSYLKRKLSLYFLKSN
jgi:glycosyltransferase involved in cell wall biosynthesis